MSAESEVTTIHRLINIHRARMDSVGIPPNPAYDAQVVDLARNVLDGKVSPPSIHNHADGEAGMCLDCDAAIVVEFALAIPEGTVSQIRNV